MKLSITLLAVSVFLGACGPNSDCGGSGFDRGATSYGLSGNGYVPDTSEGCSSGSSTKKKEICNLITNPGACDDGASN